MRTVYMWISMLGLCLLLLSGCGSAAQVQRSQASPRPTIVPTPSPTATPLPTPTPLPQVDKPVHISIPAIGVNADIEPVGVLASGNLDTPQVNPWDSTGWYESGARPGAQGSSVIDGHVDRPGGGPAVFWNLQYMQPGDVVTITTSSGSHYRFRTTKRINYPPSQAPLQGIFGNSSGTYLNLITCAGYWIPSENQTSLRTIVFTQLM